MLMRFLLCCGLATVAVSTQAMTLYKSVDANGLVFFSDRYTPGAQAFVIRERKVERPMLVVPRPDRPQQAYRYPLPWRGGPFRLTQGPNGSFSHTDAKSRYAMDIAMPEGTPIIAARSGDPEVRQRAFATILEAYWKPAYKYIRIKWQAGNEDAKDLTQSFFVTAIEKNYFASYDPSKASFQTFIRTCLDRFVANQRKSAQRLKRGGGVDHFSLDFAEAENELSKPGFVSEITPEEYFHREWVRSLFALAIEALRSHYAEEGSEIYFKLFELYDLREVDAGPESKASYAALGKEFGLTTADVTNYLAAARRKFRKIVLATLREITATEEEFRAEARALLGVKVK